LALPLYAITLFVSAFILFLVQPIIGKIILPKLGGTPQVWNTCMVFFQMVLLAGYAYTHNVSTRLTLRQQLVLHCLLLFLPLIVLLPFPFSFGGIESGHSIWTFVPELGANPIPGTLAILFTYVALPFLVVSTTAPLLQRWFVHTGHPAAKDPYFLYGASNFGSMLSLIVYPVLLEPYLSLRDQGWTYAVGYIGLIAFVLCCAAMVWNAKDAFATHKSASKPDAPVSEGMPAPVPVSDAAAATAAKAGAPEKKPKLGGPRTPAAAPGHAGSIATDDMTPGRRLRWVLLAAIPSSLMLGITTHITTDLSPIPLFWLVPLILYLASFILVFARWPVVWTEQPHVYFLYAQPFCVAFMILVDVLNFTSSPAFIGVAIFAHVLGFFTTTMMCHGELAKDRPSARHLTEFYLWMSVGGMVGGMFNGLVAPVLIPKNYEFPVAIFAAVIVRPKMFDVGILDNFIAGLFESKPEAAPAKGGKGAKPVAPSVGTVTANESLVRTLDYVWPGIILALLVALMVLLPGARENTKEAQAIAERNRAIVYTIPLLVACIGLTRPIRVGLSLGAVLLVFHIQAMRGDASIYSTRSYFGVISVKEWGQGYGTHRQLIHGHIDHGMNFIVPDKLADREDFTKNKSRLATTYYHREGPAGRVMEKFNWFPGPANTYHADARMPTSLIANAVADLGASNLPLTALVTAWSEPPFATVGLGTGTMASYGRPYHVHFYEIDDKIQRLSLRTDSRNILDWAQYEKVPQDPRRPVFFNYLERSIERGCSVQVLMGDARLRMALPYKNHYTDDKDRGGGPENFYHMMVVDAFSSDAIPAHLLTEQAFQMYFSKLTEDGILCVHTSNRFVNLPKVVSAVSYKLKLSHKRGHDNADDRGAGHYTSEWVMVAKKADYLACLSESDPKQVDFFAKYETEMKRRKGSTKYWTPVSQDPRYVWTDDYYNLLSVVRWFSRGEDD
jgi:hypothetical protein